MKDIQDAGLFRLDDYFNITNRGFYIMGEIINSDVQPGDSVLIDDLSITITSIEAVRKVPYQSLIALQLADESETIRTTLDKLKGKKIMIVKGLTS